MNKINPVGCYDRCLTKEYFLKKISQFILCQEQIEGGASIYAQKLTGGYTMYFNPKNQRNGVLFQGRSKISRYAEFLISNF